MLRRTGEGGVNHKRLHRSERRCRARWVPSHSEIVVKIGLQPIQPELDIADVNTQNYLIGE